MNLANPSEMKILNAIASIERVSFAAVEPETTGVVGGGVRTWFPIMG